MMNTRDFMFAGLDLMKRQANTVVSTVTPYIPKKLPEVNTSGLVAGAKKHATAMVSTREGAVKTAALVIGSAYFLWPAAAAPAAAGAMMKAPGAAGFVISRTAFLANPQLYFQILRKAGTVAACAAFA